MNSNDDAVQAAFDALGAEPEHLVEATRILEEHGPGPAAPSSDGPGDDTDSGATAATGAVSTTAPRGQPKVFWWAGASQSDLRGAFTHLTYFVEWLDAVYSLSTRMVPACWIQHPDIVQELWALMVLHAAAHQGDQPNGPIAFATNFDQARNRLSALAAGSRCTDGHKDDEPAERAQRDRRASYDSNAGAFTWSWPPAPEVPEETS